MLVLHIVFLFTIASITVKSRVLNELSVRTKIRGSNGVVKGTNGMAIAGMDKGTGSIVMAGLTTSSALDSGSHFRSRHRS